QETVRRLTTEENVGAALADRLVDYRSLCPVRRELSQRRPGNEGSFASWQWVSASRCGPFAGPDGERIPQSLWPSAMPGDQAHPQILTRSETRRRYRPGAGSWTERSLEHPAGATL